MLLDVEIGETNQSHLRTGDVGLRDSQAYPKKFGKTMVKFFNARAVPWQLCKLTRLCSVQTYMIIIIKIVYICNMQNMLMLIQTKDVYTYIYMYVCIKFTCINEHV
jgi:hypothetical protein